jgi:hypothetical protein
MKTTRSATAITISTTPGSRNETRSSPFFALSTLVFIVAAGVSAWKLLPVEKDGVMSCSTKAIMRFENMEKENVNGNIHLILPPTARVDGRRRLYRLAAGWLYLQRYVKFNWTSQRISSTERHYRISKWESSASSIDESPDVIFDYFMREMSDSHDGLFLNAQKLNEKAILLSSINSPLYVCTLKSGSQFD